MTELTSKTVQFSHPAMLIILAYYCDYVILSKSKFVIIIPLKICIIKEVIHNYVFRGGWEKEEGNLYCSTKDD